MSESIYNKTLQARIYTRALRMLKNHHDAQDVVQDVWLKWLRQTPDAIRNPEAWLNVATSNQVIDRLRTKPTTTPVPDKPASQPPDEPAIEQETRSRIARAIGDLPDRQREVLISKIYGDETFREIAERLRLSDSAVKTHYIRALQNLRKTLADIDMENES